MEKEITLRIANHWPILSLSCYLLVVLVNDQPLNLDSSAHAKCHWFSSQFDTCHETCISRFVSDSPSFIMCYDLDMLTIMFGDLFMPNDFT